MADVARSEHRAVGDRVHSRSSPCPEGRDVPGTACGVACPVSLCACVRALGQTQRLFACTARASNRVFICGRPVGHLLRVVLYLRPSAAPAGGSALRRLRTAITPCRRNEVRLAYSSTRRTSRSAPLLSVRSADGSNQNLIRTERQAHPPGNSRPPSHSPLVSPYAAQPGRLHPVRLGVADFVPGRRLRFLLRTTGTEHSHPKFSHKTVRLHIPNCPMSSG